MCFSARCNHSWQSVHCEKCIWSRDFCRQHANGSTLISLRNKGINSHLPFRYQKQTETSCTTQIWLRLHSAFRTSKYNYCAKERNKRVGFESPWVARIIGRQLAMNGFQWQLSCSRKLWLDTSVGEVSGQGRMMWLDKLAQHYSDVGSWCIEEIDTSLPCFQPSTMYFLFFKILQRNTTLKNASAEQLR